MSINTSSTETDLTFKRLQGRAETDTSKSVANEALGSGVTTAAVTTPGLAYPAAPTQTLYAVASVAGYQAVEYLRLPLVIDPTSNGHAYLAQLPAAYQASTTNGQAGVPPFLSGQVLSGTSGALQTVPQQYGAGYEPQLYTGGTTAQGSGTRIGPLDPRGWVWDPYAGILFQETVTGPAPSYIEAFLYIGPMVSTILQTLQAGLSQVALHPAYAAGNTITTTALLGNVTVAGTERLSVTATGGVSITNALTLSNTTAGSVLFAGTAGLVQQDNANLFWDDTNNRLGIGNAVPTHKLHIGSAPAGSVPTGAELLLSGTSPTLRFADGSHVLYLDTNASISSAQISTFNYGTSTPFQLVLNANGGNVGIKSLTAGSQLSVQGNTSIGGTYHSSAAPTGGLIVEGSVGIGTSSPSALLSVGSGSKFQVDTNGNILKINNVATSFPASQGAASTYLQNDGSGVLTWGVAASSTELDTTQGSIGAAISGSGSWVGFSGTNYLDSALTITASLILLDTQLAATTLQQVYNNDVNGSDALITTNSTDGSVVIAGTEALVVTATSGLVAAEIKLGTTTRYRDALYVDSTTLTGGSTAVAPAFNFSASTYSGTLLAYVVRDAVTLATRVGHLMVSTDGTVASLTDFFTETADVGLSWTVALSGSTVQLTYTTTTNNKTMRTEIQKFLT